MAPKPPKPQVPGVLKGLGVTLRTAKETIFPDGMLKPPSPSKGAATVQYPREKETPAPRARGVIALKEDNCTACMLCARECPDWCIYIEAHKTLAPPRREGGKPQDDDDEREGRGLSGSRLAAVSSSSALARPGRSPPDCLAHGRPDPHHLNCAGCCRHEAHRRGSWRSAPPADPVSVSTTRRRDLRLCRF